jgi:hypothetical protein
VKNDSILLSIQVAVDQPRSSYLEEHIIVCRPANRVCDKPAMIFEIVMSETAIEVGR